MSISNETWCLRSDPIITLTKVKSLKCNDFIITLTRVKSLKCNEPISFWRSHNDLGQWIAPHLHNNDGEMFKMFMDDQMLFVEAIN
jgi:hypothetical protein